jgi:hypothetical protein
MILSDDDHPVPDSPPKASGGATGSAHGRARTGCCTTRVPAEDRIARRGARHGRLVVFALIFSAALFG